MNGFGQGWHLEDPVDVTNPESAQACAAGRGQFDAFRGGANCENHSRLAADKVSRARQSGRRVRSTPCAGAAHSAGGSQRGRHSTLIA